MGYTKQKILNMAETEDVEFIRLQFTDLFGTLKNVAITKSQLAKALDNKIMFDGSSIEGFARIEESDMYLYPDYDTFEILPFRPHQGKVARMICDVYKPDGTQLENDPRYILKKVLKEAEDMGYEFNVGPECEFFLFHTDDYGNPTTISHEKGSYFDLGPTDLGENARRDMVLNLEEMGFEVEASHHEVAPAQHELAPIYTTTNIATDHNQLTMEIMQKIAAKHGLVCLLHEKPFAGVNGSGKHNNWSISTDKGQNLLSPGETPYENAQFLLFLCAVIKAVDDYQDLLRISVATAGNDHRLGANEAPPAVVSIFLGDELNAVLEAIENDTPYQGAKKTKMKLGVDVLPKFNRDNTDRNRTSPFAFTGNKFEFRMLGSSNSIACANIMLNSAVAESLKIYADRLEQAQDFETALHEMIRKTIKDHKHIIFNGNGYDDNWIKEATEKRGLINYRTTVDCMPHLLDEKNVKMLTGQGVFSIAELQSRCDIMLDNYCKSVIIEANTMVTMAKTQIAPAVESYAAHVADAAVSKKALDANLACSYETNLVRTLSTLTDTIAAKVDLLNEALRSLETAEDIFAESFLIRDHVLGLMNELRAACDEAETLTAKSYWPFPTYADLLFGVK